MPLRDQFGTALVTGASSGLGAAFTEMLLAEGIAVWGTSRRPEVMASRPGLRTLALELADDASIRRAWAEAERESGGIDLLVNNAGAGLFGEFDRLTDEEVRAQIEILLIGPALLARQACAAMRARGRGCVVNISSLAAEFPIPYLVPYSAAKAGLAGLSAGLCLETAGSGVRVIDFRPGDYRTRFNDTMRPQPGAAGERGARVWRRLEGLLQSAPAPRRAADDLRRALLRGRSGVVRSGSFFQAWLAPLLQRFASQGLSRRVQRRYFELR